MRFLIAIFVAALAAPASAGQAQDKVLACFSEMGQTTDWGMCLNAMFAPCANEEIGSESHLACLIQQRSTWQAAKRTVEAEVIRSLNDTGLEELGGLMLAWPKFVEQKCEAVASSRADISYDAAQLGCQISEFALMTNELTACIKGRSVEEYCQTEE